MEQSLDQCFFFRVLSRSFHRRSIQHNRRHKLKRGLIHPKGQTNLCYPLCGSGSMISRIKLWNFDVPKDAISCILREKFGRKWVVYDHMQTELHEASSAVLPFWIPFSSSSISVSANFNNRNSWLHWLHAILHWAGRTLSLEPHHIPTGNPPSAWKLQSYLFL